MDFLNNYKIEHNFYSCTIIKYCSILNKWNLIPNTNLDLKHKKALNSKKIQKNYNSNNNSEIISDNEEKLDISCKNKKYITQNNKCESTIININNNVDNTLSSNELLTNNKEIEFDNKKNIISNNKSCINYFENINLEKSDNKNSLELKNDYKEIFQRSKNFKKEESSKSISTNNLMSWRANKNFENSLIKSDTNSCKSSSTKNNTVKTSSINKETLSYKEKIPLKKSVNLFEKLNNQINNKIIKPDKEIMLNSVSDNIYTNYFYNSKSLNNSQTNDDNKSEENSYTLNKSNEIESNENNINNNKNNSKLFNNLNTLFFNKFPISCSLNNINIFKYIKNNNNYFHKPKLLNKKKNIKFLTYNVWFSQYNFKQRSEEIIKILQSKDPDFICLQEVTESFMLKLLNSSFIKLNFYISNVPCQLSNWYDIVILSKYCCNAYVVPFLSKMHRKLMYITLYNPDNELLKIGTAHFESFNSKIYTRESQIKLSYDILNNYEKDKDIYKKPDYIFLLGDFNLAEKDNIVIENSGYTDWGYEIIKKIKIENNLSNNKKSKCLFNNKEELNTMKQMKGYPAWRPDRFTFKNNSSTFSIINFEILGKKDIIIDNNNPVNSASDHYAIYAECNL